MSAGTQVWQRRMMTVAVCITSYRCPDAIAACVAALEVSTYDDFCLVICENGGMAAAQALAERLPAVLRGGQPVLVIDAGGNTGFAGGTNLAISASPHASALWLLNPDTVPAPEALAALKRRLDEGNVDAVGGVVHFADGRIQGVGGRWQGIIGRIVSLGHGRQLGSFQDQAAVERRQNFLIGASLLVSRRFLQIAGPMREDYFLYCEEVEWALRAVRRGLRLGHAPDALVRHDEGTTTGSGGGRSQQKRLPVYLNQRNRVHLIRDTRPALLPLAVPAMLAQIAMSYVRIGAWSQAGYALHGLMAGLSGERGLPGWLDDV